MTGSSWKTGPGAEPGPGGFSGGKLHDPLGRERDVHRGCIGDVVADRAARFDLGTQLFELLGRRLRVDRDLYVEGLVPGADRTVGAGELGGIERGFDLDLGALDRDAQLLADVEGHVAQA